MIFRVREETCWHFKFVNAQNAMKEEVVLTPLVGCQFFSEMDWELVDLRP